MNSPPTTARSRHEPHDRSDRPRDRVLRRVPDQVAAVIDDDVTLGELARSLGKLDEKVTERFKDLNARLDSQRFVSIELYESETLTQDKRLDSLEERLRNAVRTGAGLMFAVIIPTITTVIALYIGSR